MSRIIGVIGAGTMGTQLALALLSRNYSVVLKLKSLTSIGNFEKRVEELFQNSLMRRYLGNHSLPDLIGKINYTTSYQNLNDCSLVIECVNEDFEIKKNVILELNKLNNPNLIVASNTSTMLINRLAQHYLFPDNLIGIHFFNPIFSSKLVEVSEFIKCSSVDLIIEILTSIDKKYFIVPDKNGFLINRLIFPFWIETIREIETSDLKSNEIDNAIKQSLNHTAGPFEIADIIGIDVFVDICNSLFNETADKRFQPPKILTEMVKLGKLGKKNGEGFYKWENNELV